MSPFTLPALFMCISVHLQTHGTQPSHPGRCPSKSAPTILNLRTVYPQKATTVLPHLSGSPHQDWCPLQSDYCHRNGVASPTHRIAHNYSQASQPTMLEGNPTCQKAHNSYNWISQPGIPGTCTTHQPACNIFNWSSQLDAFRSFPCPSSYPQKS